MVWGKLYRYMQKLKLDHLLIPYTRINSKWIKDLNVRLEAIKLVEKNIDSKTCDISLSYIFSDISPWAREKKKKINRDFIKPTSFAEQRKPSTK